MLSVLVALLLGPGAGQELIVRGVEREEIQPLVVGLVGLIVSILIVQKPRFHFNANETRTFDLDLTKLFWNASIRSDWPRWDLFEMVPAGQYSLLLEMAIGKDRVTSNEVVVKIRKRGR